MEEEWIKVNDVGCNTGELTKQLYTYLSTIYSNAKIKMLAIDIDPTLIKRAQEHNNDCNILFTPCDITTDEGHKLITEFIKIHNKDILDIIFCFSVTMWIHINNGDQGLAQVLKFIKENSRTIIIEPQPWKCYKNAQRRMRRSVFAQRSTFYSFFLRKIINKEKLIKDLLSPWLSICKTALIRDPFKIHHGTNTICGDKDIICITDILLDLYGHLHYWNLTINIGVKHVTKALEHQLILNTIGVCIRNVILMDANL
ncbi:unnamed protein product, partial [Brenthis ino]